MPEQWTAEDFHRRSYRVEGEHLDRAKKIRVVVMVDGKKEVDIEAREPGMLAILSLPTEQGIDIEIVEAGAKRYIDALTPDEAAAATALKPWQRAALGL